MDNPILMTMLKKTIFIPLMLLSLLPASLAETPNMLTMDGWHVDSLKHGYGMPILNTETGTLTNKDNIIGFAIYQLEQPIVLNQPGDRLDFSYQVNIAYTGVPYGYSCGIGLLTLRGSTNIHAGLGGKNNGEFNAATDQNPAQNCYHFYHIGNGATQLKAQLSQAGVIQNQEDTSISGHLFWDMQLNRFVINFEVQGAPVGTLELEKELRFEGVGLTLYGPSGSTAELRELHISHSPAYVPEPGTCAALLLSIPLLSLRRKRRE